MSKLPPEARKILLRTLERLRRIGEDTSALRRGLAKIEQDYKQHLEDINGMREELKNISSLFDEYSAEIDQDQKKRLTGILTSNDARQRKAIRDHRFYLRIVKELTVERPHLKRASDHRLARAVQSELVRRGRAVSIRTIERAIRSQNKV
jgi:Skp family chaperone for outer membrane proteins